uniref:Uncharacterized protein n=1 Tax=Romanomermis culicivorax TaxID=13658 RepID=A0A915L434_ROMCU
MSWEPSRYKIRFGAKNFYSPLKVVWSNKNQGAGYLGPLGLDSIPICVSRIAAAVPSPNLTPPPAPPNVDDKNIVSANGSEP